MASRTFQIDLPLSGAADLLAMSETALARRLGAGTPAFRARLRVRFKMV